MPSKTRTTRPWVPTQEDIVRLAGGLDEPLATVWDGVNAVEEVAMPLNRAYEEQVREEHPREECARVIGEAEAWRLHQFASRLRNAADELVGNADDIDKAINELWANVLDDQAKARYARDAA